MPLTFSPPVAAVRQVPTSPGDATKFLNGATPPAFTTPAGGGSPGLPILTYTAGTIGNGLFTTDNASIALTTAITFSRYDAAGNDRLGFHAYIPDDIFIIFTDSSGRSSLFQTATNDQAGNTTFTFYPLNLGYQGAWSGVYQLSFATGPMESIAGFAALAALTSIIKSNGAGTFSNAVPGTDYVVPGGEGTVVADTGWTANADGGDKTAVIPNNATIDGMQAALNLVSAGLGDLIVALADKVKALETVLVGNKLPNA